MAQKSKPIFFFPLKSYAIKETPNWDQVLCSQSVWMRDEENTLIGFSDMRRICVVNITWLMLVQHKLMEAMQRQNKWPCQHF